MSTQAHLREAKSVLGGVVLVDISSPVSSAL